MLHDSEQKEIASLIDGVQYFRRVTLPEIKFDTLILGESFHGKMREFNLYSSFLGAESFLYPSFSNLFSLP